MTAATAEAPANTVHITDAGPSRKKVSIEIPAETVTEKLKESLDTLAYEAQLPGFRKGRAPRGLIEKKFGQSVRAEATRQLVATAYSKAVEDHKLRVIGEPTADQLGDLEAKEGQPLKVDLEVEVLPEFDLPGLDGMEIRKPVIVVTDEMVDSELRKLAINEGRLEQRDNAEPGDYLTGRGVMKGPDGTEFYNIPGAVVQVPTADKGGKGMILGIMVDDFAKQLGIPKPGETVKVAATGPESHEIEGVRNARLSIEFAVDRIDRIIPAELAELAQKFGFDSPDQVKEIVRARLSQRAMIEQQSAMRQQVARRLVEGTSITLPERLTAQQSARTLERQRMELMYRGVQPQQIEEHMAELRAASGNQAAGELKLFFILNKAGDDLKVSVSEAEINGRIAQLAAEQSAGGGRSVRPEQLRQELIQRNQIGTVYQQVREHKTYDAILAKAKITEVPLDEYNKSIESERAEGRKTVKKTEKHQTEPPEATDSGEKPDKPDKGDRGAKKTKRS
ncbi:MAG: trigger factor [Phycisphaerales bacterium]|nr:trigger factor [Phycisphaerales bacterium]